MNRLDLICSRRPDLRERLEAIAKTENGEKLLEDFTADDALCSGFTWAETDEGAEFWAKVSFLLSRGSPKTEPAP